VRSHSLLNTHTHTHTHTQSHTGALTTRITVIFVFNFFPIAYNLQTTLDNNKLHYKCCSCSFKAPPSNLPVVQNRNLIISFYSSYLAVQGGISPPCPIFYYRSVYCIKYTPSSPHAALPVYKCISFPFLYLASLHSFIPILVTKYFSLRFRPVLVLPATSFTQL